jgi:K+-dependent Na+/Ca+ exchanger-like protein
VWLLVEHIPRSGRLSDVASFSASQDTETYVIAPHRRLNEDFDSGYWADALIDRPYRTSSKKYWIFVHIIIIGYMLLGLNTVCDLYFTGALDEMVNKWKIKPDVAGATFMAAGGSAPELFTSLIGAVVSESDVGFGTIVGSAVFNVLFVIGLCGFSAKEPIQLTWWPLARDCTYYIFGLSMLALFAKTGKQICLWEAIVLFVFYKGYCVVMYFNPQLEEMVLGGKTEVTEMTPVTPLPDTGSTLDTSVHHIKQSQPHFERKSKRLGSQDMTEIASEIEDVHKSESTDGDEDEDDIEALLERPSGTVPQLLWFFSLPVYGSLYYSIPKPSEKMFLFTFCLSLFWIAFFSFFLVYCVEIFGEVLGIHIIVMGFTLLAAGTSIPDLVSSMAVARAGEGDMAVSSSIGSNIFDILVGLPVPWIIKIAFVEMAINSNGSYAVAIKSDYIVLYVIILIIMIFCVIVSIHLLGWKLNKTLGVGMAVLYAIFLVIVLLVEFGKPEAFKW